MTSETNTSSFPVPSGIHDHFTSLPPATMTHLLQLVIRNLQDASRYSLVSKHFHRFIFGDKAVSSSLWQALYFHSFTNPHMLPIENNFLQAYRINYLFESNLSNGICTQKWDKGNYISTADGKILRQNRKELTVTDQKTGRWLDSFEVPLTTRHVAAGEGKVAFCTIDDEIKILDLETGAIEHTLPGHELTIHSMSINNGKIFSCSSDHTIKIWDLSTGALLQTLTGHEHYVNCVIVAEGKIISGSADSTIRIWDLKDGTLTRILHGTDPVTCLAYANDTLFSGHSNGTLKRWDMKSGDQKAIRTGLESVVSLAITNEKIVCLGKNKYCHEIIFLNAETGEKTPTHFKQYQINSREHITLSEGKILIGYQHRDCEYYTDILNFIDIENKLLTAIASQIISPNISNDRYKTAMRTFSRMPKGIRNKIYEELYNICKPFKNDYWGCAEDAFHERKGQISSPAQKAEAIRAYLAKSGLTDSQKKSQSSWEVLNHFDF